MAAPSHSHFHLLLVHPQTLALTLTPWRAPSSSVSRFRRLPPRRRLLRPVAALGGGGFADVGELFGRVEALLYTVADAAVSASPVVVEGGAKETTTGDWLSGITNSMETVLKVRAYLPRLRALLCLSVSAQLVQGRLHNCAPCVCAPSLFCFGKFFLLLYGVILRPTSFWCRKCYVTELEMLLEIYALRLFCWL